MDGVGIALGAISKGCGAPAEGVGLPARRSPAPSTARDVGWGLLALLEFLGTAGVLLLRRVVA